MAFYKKNVLINAYTGYVLFYGFIVKTLFVWSYQLENISYLHCEEIILIFFLENCILEYNFFLLSNIMKL